MSKIDLFLHTPDTNSKLSSYYERAFNNAVELFMVTAYLTDWNENLILNNGCKSFRVIIGKDFGITRKLACNKLLQWLPPKSKGQFLVADQIGGFHPKAVFWKEANQKCFAIIGSSNLTRAAFETNYEANVYCEMLPNDYAVAKKWLRSIEKQSIIVSEDWLAKYVEAPPSRGRRRNAKDDLISTPIVEFKLPRPQGTEKLIIDRRNQLKAFSENVKGLEGLFSRCAKQKINSATFYKELPKYWSVAIGDRITGPGFEILGKHSNFQELSQSYMRVIKATNDDRDDIVVEEIDRLAELRIPTRKAFFSEMLCLRFPNDYPVLNDPVRKYLHDIKLKAPRGASEGVRYIDLARNLRASLLQNPKHPAKNLAELDVVIWKVYGRKPA